MATIHGDRWEGVFNHEWSVERALAANLEACLEQLDANTFTLFSVNHDEKQHLTVGGGAGRYVVYATFDNDEFWNLLGADRSRGTILLNAGGQQGDYPIAQVVTKTQARAAAIVFLETGELDRTQEWQKQN